MVIGREKLLFQGRIFDPECIESHVEGVGRNGFENHELAHEASEPRVLQLLGPPKVGHLICTVAKG
ncbi:MAG: hypothetical protein PVH30_07390 [Desulfobacterales bacterium]|jgi:hypothetical protein